MSSKQPTMAVVRIQVGGLSRLLGNLETDRFGCCITDVPEGHRWVNASWRHTVPPPDVWREVLRAVQPGGILAALGRPRTVHRLTASIEDAGWLVYDQIAWLRDAWAPSRGGLRGLWEPIVLARNLGQSIPSRARRGRPWPFGLQNPDDIYTDVTGRPPGNVVMPGDTAAKLGLDGLSFKTGETPEVLRWLVQSFAPRNTDVLDPFCKFGAVGEAAVELGRGFHGLEVDKGYARLAQTNIRNVIRRSKWEPKL